MSKNNQTIALLTIITVVNFCLWGCAKGTIKSCNLLSQTVTELKQFSDDYLDSEDSPQIQLVANQFKQAQETILDLKIRDEKLSNLSQQLADNYHNYSQLTENYISAYQNKQTNKIIDYQKEVKQLFVEQNSIIENINSHCSN